MQNITFIEPLNIIFIKFVTLKCFGFFFFFYQKTLFKMRYRHKICNSIECGPVTILNHSFQVHRVSINVISEIVIINSHFFHIAVNYKTSPTEQSYQIRQVSLYTCILYKYCRVSQITLYKVSDKTCFTVLL